MQNIVDKVFPHFAKEEQAAEKSMQRAQISAEEGGKRSEKAAAESEQKRNKVDASVKKRKKQQDKEAQGSGEFSTPFWFSILPADVWQRS